jgi:hypothetical protein
MVGFAREAAGMIAAFLKSKKTVGIEPHRPIAE